MKISSILHLPIAELMKYKYRSFSYRQLYTPLKLKSKNPHSTFEITNNRTDKSRCTETTREKKQYPKRQTQNSIKNKLKHILFARPSRQLVNSLRWLN